MAFVHGGRLVAQALKRSGVTHVFTLCGGHIQAVYDGCLDEGIRVVDVRHEQTAGHAADAYARMTGRPGVCAVTAGPGVTDVVTAVANAARAGVPMLVLGGAGPTPLADMGSLQDMDHVSLMRSITKWSARVTDTGRMAEYVDAAFRVAMAGMPGPVFLEIPLDVLMGMREEEPPRPHVFGTRPGPAMDRVKEAARLLRDASTPTFLLGSEVHWSPKRDVVSQAANAYQVPFFLSGLARGALPRQHPQFFARARKMALREADVVFVLGTPLDFRLDYGKRIAENAKVVQVGLLGEELGKNRAVDVPVHSDIGYFLEALLAELKSKSAGGFVSRLREEENKEWGKMLLEIESECSPPNPLRLCREVSKRLGPNDVVVGDGGDFVATAANVLDLAWPQLWMDPGPLGTLGVGPGYAMAAKLVRPEARVVILFGDGSFGLHAMEFEAMARQNIPAIAIIGNDAAWTQIRRGQVDLYGKDRAVATALDFTRYEKVVEACGGQGYWVDTLEALGPALDKAFACEGPVCVNVRISESGFRKGALSV